MRCPVSKLVLSVLMVGFLSACSGVVRDETVYRTEVSFMGQATLQQAEQLENWVRTSCQCNEGRFTTPSCEKSADLVLVVKTRIPWHTSMMLYNARLLDKRPAKTPPEIPAVNSLCPGR